MEKATAASEPRVSGWRERLQAYLQLVRMERPIGALLLLWPTLWGLWVAGEGRPDPYIVAVFVAGVFVMRWAGCAINDYADYDVDLHVERTRGRPLARRVIARGEALGVFVALSLVAFGLVLTLNRLTILLSLVGVVLTATYPFLKRWTHLPQPYLGIAFTWAIPMAFAAERNALPLEAWWLALANAVWVTAYDTQYAMVDRDDDLRVGVKSTAILAGERDLALVAALHVSTVVLLTGLGIYLDLGGYYYLGLVLAAVFCVYQNLLTRSRDRDRCFQAFLNNAWVGAAVFAGIVLAYL